MRAISGLTALACALLVATAATATTYDCQFTAGAANSGIPDRVVIQHDTATGAVTVQDPFINHYVGSPLAGTLKSLNSTRALFTWTLSGIKAESGQYAAGITYTVNIIRATGQAQITGKPQGNYEAWRGSGSCTTR